MKSNLKQNNILRSVIIALLLFLPALMLITSCEKDEVASAGEIDANCDTTNVSYAEVIEPALVDFCITCHNNGNSIDGVNLEGYENVKEHALNGRLKASMQGSGTMYPFVKGDDRECVIQQIHAWIDQGAQNN